MQVVHIAEYMWLLLLIIGNNWPFNFSIYGQPKYKPNLTLTLMSNPNPNPNTNPKTYLGWCYNTFPFRLFIYRERAEFSSLKILIPFLFVIINAWKRIVKTDEFGNIFWVRRVRDKSIYFQSEALVRNQSKILIFICVKRMILWFIFYHYQLSK